MINIHITSLIIFILPSLELELYWKFLYQSYLFVYTAAGLQTMMQAQLLPQLMCVRQLDCILVYLSKTLKQSQTGEELVTAVASAMGNKVAAV